MRANAIARKFTVPLPEWQNLLILKTIDPGGKHRYSRVNHYVSLRIPPDSIVNMAALIYSWTPLLPENVQQKNNTCGIIGSSTKAD